MSITTLAAFVILRLSLTKPRFWSLIPDDWGRPDGRAPRDSCLAISAHLSDRRAGTVPPRWGGETLVQAAEFFMQRLRTPSAGSNSPPPWLSGIRTSPARHLRHHFFHFWPLVQTLGRFPTVGSPWSSSTPPSLRRGRVAPPPLPSFCWAKWCK